MPIFPPPRSNFLISSFLALITFSPWSCGCGGGDAAAAAIPRHHRPGARHFSPSRECDGTGPSTFLTIVKKERTPTPKFRGNLWPGWATLSVAIDPRKPLSVTWTTTFGEVNRGYIIDPSTLKMTASHRKARFRNQRPSPSRFHRSPAENLCCRPTATRTTVVGIKNLARRRPYCSGGSAFADWRGSQRVGRWPRVVRILRRNTGRSTACSAYSMGHEERRPLTARWRGKSVSHRRSPKRLVA